MQGARVQYLVGEVRSHIPAAQHGQNKNLKIKKQKNSAYLGSRATLLSGSVVWDRSLFSHLKKGPHDAFLSLGCYSARPWWGAWCTEGIQTKGKSHPHPDRFKYKRDGCRPSSARSLCVFKDSCGNCPGGPVANTLCSQRRGPGLNPWSGS